MHNMEQERVLEVGRDLHFLCVQTQLWSSAFWQFLPSFIPNVTNLPEARVRVLLEVVIIFFL